MSTDAFVYSQLSFIHEVSSCSCCSLQIFEFGMRCLFTNFSSFFAPFLPSDSMIVDITLLLVLRYILLCFS